MKAKNQIVPSDVGNICSDFGFTEDYINRTVCPWFDSRALDFVVNFKHENDPEGMINKRVVDMIDEKYQKIMGETK